MAVFYCFATVVIMNMKVGKSRFNDWLSVASKKKGGM